MTNLDAADIVIAVAKQRGLRPSQLQHKASPRGEVGRLVFRAKCHAMRLLRDGGLSLPRIARAMGCRATDGPTEKRGVELHPGCEKKLLTSAAA